MSTLKKVKDMYGKFRFILTTQQKVYFWIVLAMSLVAALLEMVGVAAIIPILDMMLDMDEARTKWFVRPFIEMFHLDTDQKVIWFMCTIVIAIYIFKNVYNIFFNWVYLKYANKVQRELSVRVLDAYLKQGYIFFVENNTAALLQGVREDVSAVYNMVKAIFALLTKIFTAVCIAVYIFAQSSEMAVVLCGLALLSIALLQIFYRKPMSVNGKMHRQLTQESSQISLEAIQGNKEIIAMQKQDFFSKYYAQAVAKRNRFAVKVELGTLSPAYFIEMICITGLMAAVAVQMGASADVNGLLTRLSTIAVGAFRILPAVGGITSGINTVTMYMTQFERTYQTLKTVKQLEEKEREKGKDAPRENRSSVRFEKELRVCGVTFAYPNGEGNVLNQIDLCVKKGQSIALIGPSGAGKTTLADILLGLLKPLEGKVMMDGTDIEELGEDWGRIVGYVPQTMYLIDDTIKYNIAFGEAEQDIDEERIWESLRVAQLDTYVRSLRHGIDTEVGELGVRFSGGQRQRLAIARALYRNPDILILDEATAALDNETEAEVMKAIEALQGYKTLIIVAHRLTTVRKCDMIYEVKDGAVVEKSKEDIDWFGDKA